MKRRDLIDYILIALIVALVVYGTYKLLAVDLAPLSRGVDHSMIES